jgi:hypothetical protein
MARNGNPNGTPARAKLKPGRKESARKNQTRINQKQRLFFEALRGTFAEGAPMNVAAAGRLARISSKTIYVEWMRYPSFVEEWNKVLQEYEGVIRAAVRTETERRGIHGWDEVHEERVLEVGADGQPKVVEVKQKKVHKFSDMLLALRNNQLFGDARRMEITGRDGGPVEYRHGLVSFEQWLDMVSSSKE